MMMMVGVVVVPKIESTDKAEHSDTTDRSEYDSAVPRILIFAIPRTHFYATAAAVLSPIIAQCNAMQLTLPLTSHNVYV
jgi:hypothetical protein